jgi:hypothetical protein
MPSRHIYARFLTWPALLFGLLFLAMLACSPAGGPFEENFDSAGNWGTGSDASAEGNVNAGRYELLVKEDLGLFWSTAGKEFGDGIFQVETIQLEGTEDNGYGMMFRVNSDSDDFYLFEISSDGFVWIGRCTSGCETEATPIVDSGWFESPAINRGLNSTNILKVRAEGPNLIFFVNDVEVGRVTDPTFGKGDIGILVETLGEGGVRIAFDNFKVLPLEE